MEKHIQKDQTVRNQGVTSIVGLDLETTGLSPRTDKVTAIAIVTNESETVIDVATTTKEAIIVILESLKKYDYIVAHNAKFDASFIYTNFGILYDNLYCTMIGSQIIKNGTQFSHNLLNCLYYYTGIRETNKEHKKLMQYKFIHHPVGTPISDDMKEYVLSDTRHLIPLYNAEMKLIRSLNMEKVIALESKLITPIIKMEIHGCLVDRKGWYKMLGKWEGIRDDYLKAMDAEIISLSERIPALSGGKYTRPRHSEVLFQGDLFGASKRIKTDSKGSINFSSSAQVITLIELVDGVTLESVDEDSLHIYLNENPDTVLQKLFNILLSYRVYDKLLTTYGQKFLNKLDGNNYIHTNYSQCRTKTGRLASSSPNLQNIPGGEIRNFFIAKPGHQFITCDMDMAEITIAADFSGDPLLIANVRGGDMHSQLASTSFSIIFGETVIINNTAETVEIGNYTFQKKALRKAHKSVTFAKFYKAGVERVYKTLSSYINLFHKDKKKRLQIARKVSKAIDKEMPVLTKYLSAQIDKAQAQGSLRGVLGRIRRFDGEVYGQAANFGIQNCNAEAMKLSMILIDKYLTSNNYGRLVMNIHDEIVVEVPNRYAEDISIKIEELLAYSLSYFLTTLKGSATANISKHWEK